MWNLTWAWENHMFSGAAQCLEVRSTTTVRRPARRWKGRDICVPAVKDMFACHPASVHDLGFLVFNYAFYRLIIWCFLSFVCLRWLEAMNRAAHPVPQVWQWLSVGGSLWVRTLCLGPGGCQFKSHGWWSDFIFGPLSKVLNPQMLQKYFDPTFSIVRCL